MQLDDGVRSAFANGGELVFKKSDFGLKKRALLVDLNDLKATFAFGGNVEPPVLIFLDHRNDSCRTPDRGQRAFLGSNHPKRTVLRQALADHLLVTRLKNMQRQRCAGKDDNFKRK